MLISRRLSKEEILDELEFLRSFEAVTGRRYLRMCADERLKNEEVKDAFRKIAADEERHAQLVQEIINIAKR
jgi:rubrerythrin